MVAVHKYGFFLCRQGSARILLGSNTYRIRRNHLCIYTPNTFFRILEKSPDLKGILEEDDVEAYYPVLSPIDIRKRLQVRNAPCVKIPEAQAKEILHLYDMARKNRQSDSEKDRTQSQATDKQKALAARVHADFVRYLRYALCLKVLEIYFNNTPMETRPQDREDAILNRFLVSVYENCHRQRTVRYYAEAQHLSPYYFSSIIRERSGKSALLWIGDVTMTFSRQYLERPEMSIKEIAERLNFPDQSTFGRYFKQHEGCSPSEFRTKRFQH